VRVLLAYILNSRKLYFVCDDGHIFRKFSARVDCWMVPIICLNIQVGTILINCIFHNEKETYYGLGASAYI